MANSSGAADSAFAVMPLLLCHGRKGAAVFRAFKKMGSLEAHQHIPLEPPDFSKLKSFEVHFHDRFHATGLCYAGGGMCPPRAQDDRAGYLAKHLRM